MLERTRDGQVVQTSTTKLFTGIRSEDVGGDAGNVCGGFVGTSQFFRDLLHANPFGALCYSDAATAGEFFKAALLYMALGDCALTASKRASLLPNVQRALTRYNIDAAEFTARAAPSIAGWFEKGSIPL